MVDKVRICPHCHSQFDNIDGKVFANHVRWCKCNPKLQEYKNHLTKLHLSMEGHKAWNKGLNKNTDKRVQEWCNTMRDLYASGQLKGTFTGRHHSNETKEKMRISALKSTHQRVCKKTFVYRKLNGDEVKMDSTYELIVARILDANGIEWVRPSPIQWVDDYGIVHNYFADFFIPSKNIYIDPKNEYCFRVQADKIRCLSEQYNNIFFLHKNDLTDSKILELCV